MENFDKRRVAYSSIRYSLFRPFIQLSRSFTHALTVHKTVNEFMNCSWKLKATNRS